MVCIKSYYYNYRLITSCLEFIKLSVRALRCASISSNTLQLYLMQNSFTVLVKNVWYYLLFCDLFQWLPCQFTYIYSFTIPQFIAYNKITNLISICRCLKSSMMLLVRNAKKCLKIRLLRRSPSWWHLLLSPSLQSLLRKSDQLR